MSMHKFRVREHNWQDGQLQFEEVWFSNIDDATRHAFKSAAEIIKVYDAAGFLLQHLENGPKAKHESPYA